MTVVYEDNHLIIVNKAASEIVQGDKTGDEPLSESLKRYLKEKYRGMYSSGLFIVWTAP